MATRTRKTAAPVETEEVEETTAEQTPKQIINAGIDRFNESVTVNGQHFRYKSLRAIAYQAFVEAIENGDFDELVGRAIANADSLPSGFELARAPKDEAPAKAPKAAAKAKAVPAKKAPAKAAPKAAPAKPAARKRPTR